MSGTDLSDFHSGSHRRLCLSMPLLSDEDKPINLTMRQPSFSYLIGTLEAKNGETLSDSSSSNPRVVFDTPYSVPHETSLQISRSSLYKDLKRDSLNLSINTSNEYGSNFWDDGQSSQFGNSNSDVNSSLIMDLQQLNSARWREIGYNPQSVYNQISA
ncbi:hypothetical protein M9Y10_045977 [Tritrichomonas musculus]|uniref:Uncharacterized protein n=1 Tax=Tritrichomonas musculus TaxID=1915356 RepID=A0ABR2JWS7_9EUKA